MKTRLKLVASAAALCVASAAAAAPFGETEDVAFATALWAALEENRLAGEGAVHGTAYEGLEPHGFVLDTLDAEISVEGRAGVAIVKRNYGPEGVSVEDVRNDPGAHLKAVTVMFRREAGYDPENKDWFWAKYLPDGSLDVNPKGMSLAGRVAKGNDSAGCIACHVGALGGDLVFNNDRFADY